MAGVIEVSELKARKLGVAADSEPIMCVVSVEKQQDRTAPIPIAGDSLEYKESFKFDVGIGAQVVEFSLWTQSGKEFLGQASLPLSVIKNKPVETWYKLEKRKWRLSDKVSGDLHMTVSFTPANQNVRVGIDDFTILSVLGKGGFGKVMQVQKKDSGRIYAMKVIKKEHILQRQEVEHTLAEKDVLTKLNHPFIINLKFSFQNEEKLYLILDFLNGGELFYHLQREQRFSEDRSRFYAAEITLAIDYLHKQGIIYRDLKPENILLDGYGHICVTDFGLCKQGLGFGEKTNTFCGSLEYLAPEILNNPSGYGKAVDWWSLGILIYEMMAGIPPFYNDDQTEMAKLILTKNLEFSEIFSKEAKDLITRLLHRVPEKRLQDGDEVKAHPWFSPIDWDALYQRKVETPFKPFVSSPTDIRNFDNEFTSERPIDSVVQGSAISQSVQKKFEGFTFVSQSELNKS